MFTGEYRHTVDEKGRLAVPARFRAALAEGAFVSKGIDPCVAIYPRDVFEAIGERAASLPITDTKARNFHRHLFGTAFEQALDGQGRVVVPSVLREYASLGTDVVVVGVRDHVEVWSADAWREFSALMGQPGVLAEAFQGLGI